MTDTTSAAGIEVNRPPRDETVPMPWTDLDHDEINLADFNTWGRHDIHGILAKRREERPIAVDEHAATGRPFWSVTRWDHVAAISADHARFTSTLGVSAVGDPGEPNVVADTMIVQDPPEHTLTRKLVNKGFTPKQVRSLAPAVERRVLAIVDRLRAEPVGPDGKAHVEFVAAVAQELPAAVICDMMGIPEEDQQRMVDLTNRMLSPHEYGVNRHTIEEIKAETDAYGLALAEERLRNPTDDLTSMLVTGRIADQPLPTDRLGAFFRLLVIAGNETTRNGIAHTMLLLSEWPEEKQRWLDAIGTPDEELVAWSAAEEVVRFSTPVIHMKRDATTDVEIDGQKIAKGDKVVMWYPAANRDPRHLPDPYRFDILREANHHAGFGPGGPHFCLGASLARREMAVTMTECLRAFPDMEVSGPPRKTRSNFLHVLAELPVSYTP